VLAVGTRELVDGLGQQDGARAPERMPERDRATVRVDQPDGLRRYEPT
jgi:hypothetical protein